MLSARKLNKIRKNMTKTLNRIVSTDTEYSIEDVIASYAADNGLQVEPITDTALALFEPGSTNFIRCDLVDSNGVRSIVLTTRTAPEPL